MDETEVIFVGGVHGVGKSTYCKTFFTPKGYTCVTASTLIKEASSTSINQSKKVNDIDRNQQILINAIENKLNKNNALVIDGHFTLINKQNEVTLIDKEVFFHMKLTRILVLKASPKLVMERLNMRDGSIWTLDFIKQFQIKEIAHAEKIASYLGLHLELVNL